WAASGRPRRRMPPMRPPAPVMNTSMRASIVATCAPAGPGCSPFPCLPPSVASATIAGVVALRQRGRLLVAGGLVLAAVPAAFAARVPASAAARADAIVWANRVFSSREALASWLSVRGTTYASWARRHPADAAILEHLSVTTHGSLRPPAQSVAPSSGGPPSAPTGGSGAVVASPRAAVPPLGATSSGSSGTGAWVIAVLLGVAALAIVAALVPAAAVVRVLGPGRLSTNRRM